MLSSTRGYVRLPSLLLFFLKPDACYSSDKSLIDRHWEQIATLCECKFDIHNENFLLRNIMEAPLLKHKEVTKPGSGFSDFQ